MTFLASRFVREEVWSGELLDGIALYCVDKFFVDRVLKIPVFILFDGSRWLRNRLQQRNGAPLESNAPLGSLGIAFL